MPIKKYLDIDSTYRNRTQYPNPAMFAVENLNINNTIVDPVCSASMTYPTPTYTNTFAYPLSNSAATVLGIEGVYISDSVFPTNIPLAQTDNIFINKVVEIINDDPEVNGGELTLTYANVESVVYTGSNTFLLETSAVYAAVDTSVIASNPPNELTSFYLSQTASDIDNYYMAKTIVVNGETRTVATYDGGRRLVTVNTALSTAPIAADTYEIYGNEEWSIVTDTAIVTTPTLAYPAHRIHNYPTFARNMYRIRDGIPVFSGTVISGGNSTSTVQLPFSASGVTGAYVDNWIWFNNQDREVYTCTIDNPVFGFQSRFTTSDLYITPGAPSGLLEPGMVIVVKTDWAGTEYLLVSEIDSVLSTTQIRLLYGFPEPLKFGDTVWFYTPSPILNEYRLITAYDGPSRVATLGGLLPSSVISGDTFDILKVSYDNYNRLNVVQSGVSMNQAVCYELELQCLTLPNLILSTGSGNRIAFYPYVYVEFSSLTSKTHTNALQTNVPNISNVIFKIPVYAVNTPASSTFVVLDGRGMTQTLKFKANDSFLVRILLPNGELFTTAQTDSLPPVIPIEAVQISLTFGIKRL